MGIDPADGPGDLPCRFRPLHSDRIDQEVYARVSPLDRAQHVCQGGAGRTGHDGDSSGIGGDRLLAAFVEHALAGELFAQLPKGQFERPDTARFEPANVELIPPGALEDLDTTGRNHFQPVRRGELELRRGTSPHDARQLTEGVLERQVEVPARVPFEVADLAEHMDRRGQGLFDRPLD